MENNVEKAITDIAIIKDVIERTQKDFSKISAFFIWIGITNLLEFIIEQFSYYFRNVNGYNSGMSVFLARLALILPLIAYIICFMLFYRLIKSSKNSISMGMLQSWGIILIGSQIFAFLYMFLLPAGNNAAINMMWRCKELIIILPVIVILFVTGVLTQMKAITIVTSLYGILYFVLFTSMGEVQYGTIGGSGTRVSASSISIRVVMTVGMIILGLFLKKGANKNGNKFHYWTINY